MDEKHSVSAVTVQHLTFRYATGTSASRGPIVLDDVSFSLPRGASCLLVGANGSGKSTLLKLIGGMHLFRPSSSVLVLGREAFNDCRLNGVRRAVNNGWCKRTIAFAGKGVAYAGDLLVGKMRLDVQERYPERRDELLQVLRIDPEWNMNNVSDGQRRRVQLFLKMIRPFEVLLLDESLAVLDVLVRRRVFNYLEKERSERGVTIMYATHIFDGLFDWPTHLLFVKRGGTLGYFGEFNVDQIPDLKELIESGSHSPLLCLVEKWLIREEEEDGFQYQENQDQGTLLSDAQYLAGGYTSGRLATLGQ